MFAEKHIKTFLFFGGHTKKGHGLCGIKFVGKVTQKLFGQAWENSGKNLPAPTPMFRTIHYEFQQCL